MNGRPWRARHLAITSAVVATLAAGGVVATVATSNPSVAASSCSAGYVALTFDDGPNGNTTTLLNTLKSAGLRATLFNIGQNVGNNASLVQAEASAGMWIGNHSWTHPYLTNLSSSGVLSELQQTQTAIQNVTGTAPKWFRPPYGATNSTVQSVESQLGLTEVLWDVDSGDWNGASTAQIVAKAGTLQAGGIMLMHDQYATTIAAIPQIASSLASRNLCAGMISTSTGRAVAPDDVTPTTTTSAASSSSPAATATSTGGGTTTGTCEVTTTISAWNTGLTASVRIANTSSAAINGWSLTFALPSGQTITSGWNATYSPTSGNVTATNASYNATIAANGSVSIGYQASHNGTATAPTSFALNGATCVTS